MSTKAFVENILRRYPPLFRLGSRAYHGLRGSFRSVSAGGPEAVYRAFRTAKEIRGSDPGDYYEFGLFRGYTFLCAYQACRELNLEKTRFYGFDSFQGLPPVEGIDKGEGEFFEGQFACSKEKVLNNLTKHGMDLSRTVLIEGFYDTILTEELRSCHPFKRVAVALFDCDLYSSTQDALNWLAPFLADDSILLFDDWYSFGDNKELGQQKAFEEFLQKAVRFYAEPLWEFPKHGRAFRLREKT